MFTYMYTYTYKYTIILIISFISELYSVPLPKPLHLYRNSRVLDYSRFGHVYLFDQHSVSY